MWINGRKGTTIDARDRGLQYGDGLFETMRVRRGSIRLLPHHLERLEEGCRRLKIAGPTATTLRAELKKIVGNRREGILKLMVTRGPGRRGYRPTGLEKCTRIVDLHSLPRTILQGAAIPVRVRHCATPMGINPALAGLKTLNRLESVAARSEWSDERIWEGLMADVDGNIVCGTMTNLFLRRGSTLMTPLLDRCGVVGVMRRWILETAGELRLRSVERRVRWPDLRDAEEVFLSNAVVGVKSVGLIVNGRQRLRPTAFDTASLLRERLDLL